MLRVIAVTGLLALALSPAAAGIPAPQQAGRHRSITIVSARVVGHVVTVRVRIVGWKLFPTLIGSPVNRPDGGHWHLFVDGRYIGGTGRLTYTIELPSGVHQVRGELVNNNHTALRPPVFSPSVIVRVP
jgi:hypothetical protein